MLLSKQSKLGYPEVGFVPSHGLVPAGGLVEEGVEEVDAASGVFVTRTMVETMNAIEMQVKTPMTTFFIGDTFALTGIALVSA
jgi:hypothetical protein